MLGLFFAIVWVALLATPQVVLKKSTSSILRHVKYYLSLQTVSL